MRRGLTPQSTCFAPLNSNSYTSLRVVPSMFSKKTRQSLATCSPTGEGKHEGSIGKTTVDARTLDYDYNKTKRKSNKKPSPAGEGGLPQGKTDEVLRTKLSATNVVRRNSFRAVVRGLGAAMLKIMIFQLSIFNFLTPFRHTFPQALWKNLLFHLCLNK